MTEFERMSAAFNKAIYSKKKRTRKKYHDRIMRQYWRDNK